MITELLHAIVQQFSLRTLYLEMVWFMTFGYVMHVFVVMILTKLPFVDVLKVIFRLQLATVIASFVVAPIAAGMNILFFSMLPSYTMWFVGQQVYIWFVVSMMFFASYVLCQVFVTVPCNRFRAWLVGANSVVGMLGFFVLKASNLLIMI